MVASPFTLGKDLTTPHLAAQLIKHILYATLRKSIQSDFKTFAKPTDHSSITEVPGIAVQRYPVSIDVNSISHRTPWQCIYTVLKDTKA